MSLSGKPLPMDPDAMVEYQASVLIATYPGLPNTVEGPDVQRAYDHVGDIADVEMRNRVRDYLIDRGAVP